MELAPWRSPCQESCRGRSKLERREAFPDMERPLRTCRSRWVSKGPSSCNSKRQAWDPDGERSATLDTVAKRAGVSKGGLLYHFPNKEALIAATFALQPFGIQGPGPMAVAPEEDAAYFVRASLWSDTPMDRSYVAATRLARSQIQPCRQNGPVRRKARLTCGNTRFLQERE